jgi:DNA-binding MarR family transcriptional regulator
MMTIDRRPDQRGGQVSDRPDGEGPGQARARPDGSLEPFRLEDFLPYRLSVVTNRISKAFAGLYSREFGLSVPEWRVMAVLGAFAPLSSNEICQLTAMDKAKVSRAVALLDGKRLLSRAPNPRDQRLIRLKLTGKGRRIHDAIVPLARDLEAQITASFRPGERVQLDDLLRRLETGLEIQRER